MKTCGGEMLTSTVVEEMDPAEMFVGLATLIVEGRVPGGGRGYGEGPHCPSPAASACRHECDPRAFLCKRGENLRKHALLLWRSGVPLCIEVLLCPDCPCGAARASSPDVASPPPAPTPTTHPIPPSSNNLPSPSTSDLLLLEQWTLSVVHHRTMDSNVPGTKPVLGSAGMIGSGGRHYLGLRELFQAVRSQLHFSQLGAWWSSSGGLSPSHVVYRLSVPTGMLMASSFVLPPSIHHFPKASLGRGSSTLEVSLSSLPRMESVPHLTCPLHLREDSWKEKEGSGVVKDDVTVAPDAAVSAPRDEGARVNKEENSNCSPGRCWTDGRSGSSGGRRRQQCQRWGAAANLSPSANSPLLPEPLLGESLLDPPPWERRGPIHGPGHLPPPPSTSHRTPLPSTTTQFLRDIPFAGKNITPSHNVDQGSPDAWVKNYPSPSSRQSSPHLSDNRINLSTPSGTSRLSRQGLARRRDLPTLNSTPKGRNRGHDSPPYPSLSFVVDDRMRMPCNRPGKHHCRHAEEDEEDGEEGGAERSRGCEVLGDRKERCRAKDCKDKCKDLGENEGEREGSCEANKKPSMHLSQKEVEEVLEALRYRNGTRRHRKRNGEDEEEDDGARGASPLCAKGPSVPLPIHFPMPYVYQLATEENLNAISKMSSLQMKEKSYSKDRVLGNSLCQNDTEFGSPATLSTPSTKGCAEESTNFHHKSLQESEKREVDDLHPPRESLSPVQCGSNVPGGRPVPSAREKARFRKSLDSAASMVFHCRTGLPLTSSPAPIRRGTRFDFDSSLNSVSAIRSALFESGERSEENEEEAESGSPPQTPPTPSILPNCPLEEKRPPMESPAVVEYVSGDYTISHLNSNNLRSVRGPRPLLPSGAPSPTSASLLGSFEESVLNGRLEPVSTVQGFTAEIGASGPTGCPKHLVVPVTVFFYTLGDNDKVSTPYLSHINLGRKGYSVPRSGTVQVTLFNPLGTVVKMFVVLYDLADMPPLSQTFLRQRTLYVPASSSEDFSRPGSTEAHKWLRYLIHLRFSSSKSGRIYLHTDIRMIIFRKSDLDTATASSTYEEAYELRSFTHGPTNPKFSPIK